MRSASVLVLMAIGALVVDPDMAHASRLRLSPLDAVGALGSAAFGPSYRKRTWSGTPYFQSYQPRFYRAYPINRYVIPDPVWGTRR